MKTHALCLGLGILATAVGASDWFDAGIESAAEWPTDGGAHVISGVGTWTNTADGEITADGRLRIVSDIAEPVSFETAVRKTPGSENVVFRGSVRFSVSETPPEPPATAKGALTAIAPKSGASAYCGIVRGGDGANAWAVLSGATPRPGEDVELEIALRRNGATTEIRYRIDGNDLLRDGAEWNAVNASDASAGAFRASGFGEIASLAGTAGSSGDTRLKLPELEGMKVSKVTVGGVEIEPDADGDYLVADGAVTTVRFKPDAGNVLSSKTMTFVATGETMTLPAEGLPLAFPARGTIAITELMASNETGLRLGDVSGLDWIEIHNAAPVPVDFAGWLVTDDPSKKTSKWKEIEGDAVVEPDGYLVVWLDNDRTDWPDGCAHAPLGLSAGGEAIALATPDGTTVVSTFTFGQQFDDVSYGVSRVVETLLDARAPSEYRVASDAWQNADGPLGMTAAANGFKVVSYQFNNGLSNLSDAERCIADPSTWKHGYPVTNHVGTLAFADGDSPSNFSPYAPFPGVSGDGFAIVATGSIRIPNAGLWTFAVGSDDGFLCELTRLGETWSFEFPDGRGYGQSTGVMNLPEAGVYDVRLVYFEGGGGASLDFSVAQGSREFSAADFHLVGSEASGVVHAGSLGSQTAVNVAPLMLGKTTSIDWRGTFTLPEGLTDADTCQLKIRYADGFTAKINGSVFASVAAEGPRSAFDALEPAFFEIPAAGLRAGANTLEVTGFNDSKEDTEFFLSPEVILTYAEPQMLHFPAPTPGMANGDGGRRGQTPTVSFSEPHGYKSGPFELRLSCPENPNASIRYTTDGSTPTEHSTLYEGPITVDRTTVFRAAVPDAESILQQDTSATYLFLDDILGQADGVVPDGFPESKAVNNQKMVYGLRADLVNGDDDTRGRLLRGFTNGIATVSLVIDPGSLFDPSHGIYVNAGNDGRNWERKLQVEQIDPVRGAANEFSVPAGLRIRGAYSRGSDFPKHSFRLFFRSSYGMSKLRFPLFGDEGADSFKKIDFRTAQNYSWANGEWDKCTFIEECFSRDTQRDMGQPYTRSRYCNLFINGVFWGVYQSEERVDQEFAATYNGGNAEDYDVVRTSQPGYVNGTVEGDASAWNALWSIAIMQGFGPEHPGNYNRVRGLAPDGSRNPDFPAYVNTTNLIVHSIIAHFVDDADSPATSGNTANNLMLFRNRHDGEGERDGFISIRHDAEHSLGTGAGSGCDNVGALTWGTKLNGTTAIGHFNPNALNYELCANPEYRMAFADQVYRHCVKTGGALTVPVALARFNGRRAELEDAIVGELARWARNGQNRSNWNTGCKYLTDFIERRLNYLINGYRGLGWYPTIDPPKTTDGDGSEFADGTAVAATKRVRLTTPADCTVYYTTDGSDPRLEGGATNATARAYAPGTEFEVPPVGLLLRARAVSASGEWSALEDVMLNGDFDNAAAVADNLRFAAFCGLPASGDGDTDEWIALTNLSSTLPLNLEGVRVTLVKRGDDNDTHSKAKCDFTLPARTLAPSSAVRFDQAACGWEKISNNELNLYLTAPDGETVIQTSGAIQKNHPTVYGAGGPGGGASLVATDFGAATTDADWRPSYALPSDADGAEGMSAAIVADPRIGAWLDTLANGGDSACAAAVASFSGSASDLGRCYLANVPPAANPQIALRIPTFVTRDDGKLTIDGELTVRGVRTERTVNGSVRLLHYTELGADPEDVTDLGNTIPIPSAKAVLERPRTGERHFYRLVIE